MFSNSADSLQFGLLSNGNTAPSPVNGLQPSGDPSNVNSEKHFIREKSLRGGGGSGGSGEVEGEVESEVEDEVEVVTSGGGGDYVGRRGGAVLEDEVL